MDHLTRIADLTDVDIEVLLTDQRMSHVLHGGPLALVFHEPSTRTRFAFTKAAHDVGLLPVDLNPGSSSEQKGETTTDTCRNLAWAGARAIVLRTSVSGLPSEISRHVDVPIINAGDGINEHPTQALGDALTLREHFGHVDGLVVAIVGDVFASRVARSNAHLLTRLGAEVRFISPSAKAVHKDVPRSVSTDNVREGLVDADVVMVLRWQDERHLTPEDHKVHCVVDKYVLGRAKPTAVVLHPGPINRGVEVTPEVIDGPQSLVKKQVECGARVRASVLRRLLSPNRV